MGISRPQEENEKLKGTCYVEKMGEIERLSLETVSETRYHLFLAGVARR